MLKFRKFTTLIKHSRWMWQHSISLLPNMTSSFPQYFFFSLIFKCQNVTHDLFIHRTIDPKPCNPRTLQKPKRGGGYPKVFLGGLPSNVTETDLRVFFGRYGKVMEVVIMYDQEKKKSRGKNYSFYTEYFCGSLCYV